MRLRSIIKVMLFPNWAVNERSRLTDLLNATTGKLVDANNHIQELTHARVRLQDRLAEVTDERERLREILDGFNTKQFVAPGHFYSPFPSKHDVEEYLARPPSPLSEVSAVRMDDAAQLELLDHLQPYHGRVPFRDQKDAPLLYSAENPHYPYTDAAILFCMLNHLRPRRLIEIGSGFSTCAILDTNRLSLESQMEVTSIDPNPELLRSLTHQWTGRLTVIESRAQDLAPAIFDQLNQRDVLFVDSTHVSKLGSDVNCIFFEILPRLKPGVIIHLHDVYAGFDYPGAWLKEGRAWNEAYLLRAFLEYNERFRILLFMNYMQSAHPLWLMKNLPGLEEGSCFWMEKL